MTLTTPKPAEASVPLSDVMLAMDVVDTLRHERALVETELAEDERRAQFIARVREIYESQGIEVSDEVVAAGVDALLEDRFRYTPPARTWSVRFAELYVERRTWALRVLAVAVAALLVWLAFWIPAQVARSRSIAAYEHRLTRLDEKAQRLAARAVEIERRLTAAKQIEGPRCAADILTSASTRFETGSIELGAVQTSLKEQRPEAEQYPDRSDALDRLHRARSHELDQVARDFAAVESMLSTLGALRDLPAEVDRLVGRLAGIELAADDARTVEELRSAVLGAVDDGALEAAREHLSRLQATVDSIASAHQNLARTRAAFEQAKARVDSLTTDASTTRELRTMTTAIARFLEIGDAEQGGKELASLAALLDVLESEYELRVAKRGRSGVWRYEKGRRNGARNHYIVVEPVDRQGRVLTLPIRSEETGQTKRVRRFGIRVPAAVYERIKADKLDNGIVDRGLFGTKSRGARAPEFEYEVAGGMITEW